jgi:hypothetical protein
MTNESTKQECVGLAHDAKHNYGRSLNGAIRQPGKCCPAGAMIAIRARRPLRPMNRTVICTLFASAEPD